MNCNLGFKRLGIYFYSISIDSGFNYLKSFYSHHGEVFLTIIFILFYKTNYGNFSKGEFILSFTKKQETKNAMHSGVIGQFSKNSSLFHVESLGPDHYTKLNEDNGSRCRII